MADKVDGTAIDLLKQIRGQALSSHSWPATARVDDPNLPLALGMIAGIAERAVSKRGLPPVGICTLEGKVESTTEDSGQAKIAEVSGPDAFFVRLHSYDETKQHAAFAQFDGKRVRVTIEVVE
jgi:hypothetical protein